MRSYMLQVGFAWILFEHLDVLLAQVIHVVCLRGIKQGSVLKY